MTEADKSLIDFEQEKGKRQRQGFYILAKQIIETTKGLMEGEEAVVEVLVEQLLKSGIIIPGFEQAEKGEDKGFLSGLELIGESRGIREVINDAHKVAQSDASVLINGETGTGKEIVARRIHYLSNRRNDSFIAINCAAFTREMLQNELFGHDKGAYTGAISDKDGKFKLADKGTLFLDEITEMSPDLQAMLLRVLEDGLFYRVGGTQEIKVDVRIISATNQNIEKKVEKGVFRKDLFYRLNVVNIDIPPLRKRRSDIPKLVDHFLIRFKKQNRLIDLEISNEAFEAICRYDWPGNVRELENAIEKAVVMRDGDEITLSNLSKAIIPYSGGKTTGAREEIVNINDILNHNFSPSEAKRMFLRIYLKYHLDQEGWNKTHTATRLGVLTSDIRKWIDRLDLKCYDISKKIKGQEKKTESLEGDPKIINITKEREEDQKRIRKIVIEECSGRVEFVFEKYNSEEVKKILNVSSPLALKSKIKRLGLTEECFKAKEKFIKNIGKRKWERITGEERWDKRGIARRFFIPYQELLRIRSVF